MQWQRDPEYRMAPIHNLTEVACSINTQGIHPIPYSPWFWSANYGISMPPYIFICFYSCFTLLRIDTYFTAYITTMFY